MKTTAVLLLSAAIFGQSVFDAVDVHPSEPGTRPSHEFIPGGRMELRGMTIAELISFAYGVDDEVITGGPAWLGTDIFDVVATVSAQASRRTPDEGMKAMLQAVLADRFKLAMHTADRPLPVFALLAGKRPLLKEADPLADSVCQPGNDHGQFVVQCHNLTMAALAARMRPWAPGNALNHPVVDLTGLHGGYDFTLRLGGGGPESISIFDAVEKQVGLKLEERRVPMPALVIDRVNRTPTPNPPGTSEKLPAEPTEFEVADVRPSRPGSELEGGVRPGGLVNFRAISLIDLIQWAYGDVNQDRIIGPKWMESERFDILAKPPSSVSGNAVRLMMKSLLAERFGLKVHYEDQPVPVYALVVGKKGPKMERTPGTERPSCKTSNADDKRTYNCQNVTMAQFAEKLRLLRPVVDATGLTETYSFVLTWTPQGDPEERSADPGGLTVFEAFERQLGLRLESQKRPMPVIVVDHVNLAPTAN